MKYPVFLFLFSLFLFGKTAGANTLPLNGGFGKTKTLVSISLPDSASSVPKDPAKVSGENKRAIAAILAFPVPFGVLGLHRIYLGTDAWVPVAYVVTLGGFGMLSLIDFIYILAATDEQFEALSHNGKLFVWVK